MFSNLWHDLRYGARSVFRRPAFAIVVVVTLAFGIGINVAIFSLVENTLLRTLPVPEPERLVNFADPGARNAGRVDGFPAFARPSESGDMETVFSYGMFRDLEREQEPFVGLAAHRSFNPILSTGLGGHSARGFLVSGGYFSVLGLQPALGRLLGPQDDQIDGVAESVVLSYSYWQNNFGSDPGVLGRTLLVDDVPLTIVGVAPQGFRGTVLSSSFLPVSVFAPITMDYSANPFDQRHFYWVHLFGRLKPGVSLEEATAVMNLSFQNILSEVEAPQLLEVSEQEREAFRSRSLVLEPGARGQTGGTVLSVVSNQFPLLLALSGVVLLLCCANVGGLILLRSTTRSGEMAVRASMGASRSRLASLFLTESLVLAMPAALLSLAVALVILRSSRLLSLLPDARISWISEAVSNVNLSVAAALIAIGIAVLSAVIIGLFPLRQLMRTEPAKALQAHGAKQTITKGVARFRVALATSQIALSMALLAVTGAFVYSLSNVGRVDLGIDIDSVAMISVDLPAGRSLDSTGRARIEEALDTIPGVSYVTSSEIPLFSALGTPPVPATVEGVAGQGQLVFARSVSPNFFRMFDIQLLAGRQFNDTDSERQVVIVSQQFVERYGLEPDAMIGRTFDGVQADGEIIGVVSDVRAGKVTSETRLPVYQPIDSAGSSTFYVRGAQPPETLLSTIREAVTRIDPNMPITNLQTMEQHFRESMTVERFLAGTSTVLGLLATALAALGLYGILAYSVAQRSREIGLRYALGAETGHVRRLVLRQVVGMAVIGLLLGAIVAWPLSVAAQNLLFGVEAGDPLVFAGAALVLVAVMLGAAYVPARRASRVNPMTVLRYE